MPQAFHHVAAIARHLQKVVMIRRVLAFPRVGRDEQDEMESLVQAVYEACEFGTHSGFVPERCELMHGVEQRSEVFLATFRQRDWITPRIDRRMVGFDLPDFGLDTGRQIFDALDFCEVVLNLGLLGRKFVLIVLELLIGLATQQQVFPELDLGLEVHLGSPGDLGELAQMVGLAQGAFRLAMG